MSQPQAQLSAQALNQPAGSAQASAISATASASASATASTPGQSIFRRQAVAATQDKWLGSVRIARPWSFSTITLLACAVGAALTAFAIFGQFTRKARLPGLLVPAAGALAVSSASMGVVAVAHVAEGQQVGAGQPLFTIDTERNAGLGNLGALVGQQIAQRQQSLWAERGLRELQNRQRLDALAQRDASLAAELRQVQGELDLAAQRIALAEKSLARQQELAKSGFVSEAQSQTKAEELLDLQGRQRNAERNRMALERERNAVQAERTQTATAWQTEQTQISRSQASLEQEASENQARKQMVVQATHAGQITALHAKAGQAVQPGSSLATIVPVLAAIAARSEPATYVRPELVEGLTQKQALSGPLQAHLYAPSRSAGFVAPGQAVLLRYAAYPYQKFGMYEGRVDNISRTPINPSELPTGSAQALMSAAQANEPLYRITVQLERQTVTAYGETQALKPGTALEADVLQDRRSIWEWVLEPVLAARAQAKVLM